MNKNYLTKIQKYPLINNNAINYIRDILRIIIYIPMNMYYKSNKFLIYSQESQQIFPRIFNTK